MHLSFRSATCLSILAAGVCACSSPEPAGPGASPDRTEAKSAAPAEVALDALGGFEATFDPATGAIAIRTLDGALDTDGPLRTKADEVTGVPASASGVPSGGGVVAFSPAAASSVGCPEGGTRCGPVRLVNRAAPNTVLRNAYAVITAITPGWSIANGDTARAFAFKSVAGAPVGYFYYEHLLASERPTPATTPADGKVGFRADRTWSFKKDDATASDAFKFTFYVFARSTACTPSVTGDESPSDPGGPGYDPKVDRDCDGVPGVSRNRAIFVDPVNGVDDATNDGTILRPFRTPTYAAAQASAQRDTLVIGAATYASSEARLDLGTFPVRNVMGAFDASNGFADRRLDVSANVDPASTRLTFATGAPHGFALYRAGASAPLYVEGLTLRATGGTDGNAYAIFHRGSGAATLTLRDVALEAFGGDGSPGTAGLAGIGGLPGATTSTLGGAAMDCSGTAGGTSGQGGGGGAGGTGFFGNGQYGAYGGSASPYFGDYARGGPGGAGGTGACGAPGAGGSGVWGLHGASGRPVAATPSAAWFSSAGYSSDAQNGVAGTGGNNAGGGGGGGGGDVCSFTSGQRGSSGGSGGCGGAAGTGGHGGGGAFGVFAFTDGAAGAVTYQGSVRITVKGGIGGRGGDGGAGGAGGVGGEPTTHARRGGRGGNGGVGGNGGAGSGGNGGPAICAVSHATSAAGSVTCVPSGGAGGAPGTAPDTYWSKGNLGAAVGTFSF